MFSEIQEKNITSVKTYVEEITKLRTEFSAANAEQWFFRGQKNAAWNVLPNIFRGDDLALEHFVIELAQRQNPVEFRDCVNNFEVLTKLQHYGLGTRLLDLSLNPLVALFFATEPSNEYIKNKNGQYSLKEHDGIVHYRLVNGCSLKDLRVRIALAVPFMEFGKNLSLEVFCDSLLKENCITHAEYENLIGNDYSEMIQMLQVNSFIVATNSNIRLIQQRGAFMISPAINIKTNIEVKSSILAKARMNMDKEFEGRLIIPVKYKEYIREELDFFNVNEATLFPELEHQMIYIQKQSKPAVGIVENYVKYVRKTEVSNQTKFDRIPPDVTSIVHSSLPTIKSKVSDEIVASIINEIKIIDWQLKESVLSRIRRDIMKNLSEVLSAVDAKSKANEIVNRLLE